MWPAPRAPPPRSCPHGTSRASPEPRRTRVCRRPRDRPGWLRPWSDLRTVRVVWQRSRVISNFLPALTGAHGDPPGAVRVDGAALSFAQLSTAAGAVAERIAGAGTVAVVATPTIE